VDLEGAQGEGAQGEGLCFLTDLSLSDPHSRFQKEWQQREK